MRKVILIRIIFKKAHFVWEFHNLIFLPPGYRKHDCLSAFVFLKQMKSIKSSLVESPFNHRIKKGENMLVSLAVPSSDRASSSPEFSLNRSLRRTVTGWVEIVKESNFKKGDPKLKFGANNFLGDDGDFGVSDSAFIRKRASLGSLFSGTSFEFGNFDSTQRIVSNFDLQ